MRSRITANPWSMGGKIVKKWRRPSESGMAGFGGIDLSGQDLQENDFSLCYLHGAKFAAANLSGSVFDRSVLVGCDFTGAKLSGTRFGASDLSESIMVGADVTKVDFERANLTKVKARGVDFSTTLRMSKQLSQAVLDECNMEGLNLTAAKLSGTLLRSSNLTRAILSKADFRLARLEHACLNSALVSGANFQGSNLSYADLTSVQASSARFDGAKFDGASALPQSFDFRNPRAIRMRSPNSHWRDDRQPKRTYWSFDEAREAATATIRESNRALGVYVCFDVDPLHWHVGNLRQSAL